MEQEIVNVLLKAKLFLFYNSSIVSIESDLSLLDQLYSLTSN